MLPDIEVYPINEQKINGGHSEVWIAVKKERGCVKCP
jgi:AraC family transcriptional regulator